MVHTPVDINQVKINQVKQLAATGHFRSIALWLNYPLVPQSIYARVQTDPSYPGYLQVLLEFEHPPKQDPLIRLVCNRLCRLESSLIRGATLIGRTIGTDRPLWQQRIKLPTRHPQVAAPAQKTASAPAKPTPPVEMAPTEHPPMEHTVGAMSPTVTSTATATANPATTRPLAAPSAQTTAHQESDQAPGDTATASPEAIIAATYGSDTLLNVPSYLVPRGANHPERRRRPNRGAAPSPVVQIRPATVDITKTSIQRRTHRRRFVPKAVVEQQFKYLRAIVVTGSAAAAFILGCMTEAITSERGEIAQNEKSPSLPTFNQGGWRPLDQSDVQEIAYRSTMRSPAIPAALETVAVMPHQPISDPQDPTVTLIFGGEVPVGDVPLQTPDAVGQVLGDLDIFREADVAMVGLGNSLAIADTSLQENYLDRTRPDAVDSLRQGGIDIVGLTGNQIMDYGRQGLTETLETLDSAGIYRVGAGRNHQEARRPEVLEVKGQRIAYLNYAPNSDEAATLAKAGLNIQERNSIVEDIAALREAVDWIVVNYRWNGDLETEPSTQQVNLSRSAIDAGADLVVGYHSQQIQGAELYKSRAIVYALGDFIFQDNPLENHNTATLRVSLRDKQMKVEFLPVSVREARPKEASGETAQAILKQIRQASNALPSPLQFPAILDAAPKRETLLKPDKPLAPVKSLGELEPGLDDTPNYGDEGFIPESEGVAPQPFDVFDPAPNSFTPETFEHLSPQPDSLAPEESFQPHQFQPSESEGWNESEGWGETLRDSAPPLDHSPLDRFNSQPDEPETEAPAPSESLEPSTVPVAPTPKLNGEEGTETSTDTLLNHPPSTNNSDGAPQALPEESPDLSNDGANSSGGVNKAQPEESPEKLLPEQSPETNNDILLPSDGETLPGYDMLENWGEKSSPHDEFNPIQEHLNSVELLDLETSGTLLPAVSVEEDNSAKASDDRNTSEAISPHDEPLVGPLS